MTSTMMGANGFLRTPKQCLFQGDLAILGQRLILKEAAEVGLDGRRVRRQVDELAQGGIHKGKPCQVHHLNIEPLGHDHRLYDRKLAKNM